MTLSRLARGALLALAAVALSLAVSPDGALADKQDDEPAAPADAAPPAEGAPVTESDPDELFDVPTTFTKEQVDEAITRGLAWLKKNQQDNGGWPPLSGDPGAKAYGQVDNGTAGDNVGTSNAAGVTALALYTLLKCKVDPKDPVVKNAFAHLKTAKMDVPDSSYECGMLLMAVCATADATRSTKASVKAKPRLSGEYRAWAQKLVDKLLETRKKFKTRVWRYNYPGDEKDGERKGGNEDLSATQIVALGLFAAHRVGVKVPPAVWEDILAYSLEQQDESGEAVELEDPRTGKKTSYEARGFSYIKGHEKPHEGKPTGGMTACGLANVMMARFVLSDGGRKQEAWDARPDAAKVQKSVYDAIAWLATNSTTFRNPKSPFDNGHYNHYWHYSLERAMDLVGLQRLGDRIWYSDIGQELITRQTDKGSWNAESSPYAQDEMLDTCFSLLFLRRATKGNIPFPSVTGGSDEPVDNR
jgi:hypothetical protein